MTGKTAVVDSRRAAYEPRVADIRPSRGWASLGLGELWHSRELLFLLLWRDIRVRYKQTVMGFGWALARPLLTMIVFSVFFGHVAKLPSEGLPYPIFAFVALLPWQLFSQGFSDSSNSLVGNQGLITKVYFPRLVIPVASVMVGLADFAIALLILIGLMAYYGVAPGVEVLVLPALVLLAMASALAVGLWTSALNVHYRDVRYAVPFIGQLWLYATPIVYPASLVPDGWDVVLWLNPMAGVVEGFRWALLGTGDAPGLLIAASAGIVVVFLITGAFFFRQVERKFADVV